MPEPFTLFLLLVAGFVVALIYMGYRMSVLGREQRARDAENERELKALTASHGWAFRQSTNRLSTLEWRIEGKTAAGRPFSLESHKSSAAASESSSLTSRMVWTCAALRSSGSAAFALGSARMIEAPRGEGSAMFVKGAVAVLGGLSRVVGGSRQDAERANDAADLVTQGRIVPLQHLDERWRIVSRDEPVARRVFDEELCAALAAVPRIKLSNVDTDDELWLSYHPDGISLQVGFFEFIEGLSDVMGKGILPQHILAKLVISIGEKTEQRLAGK